MTFDEYQKLAIRTINPKLTREERLDMLALGLLGESGEVAEAIKKWRYHGHSFDEDKLAKEIGDLCWYVACLVATYNSTLSAVLEAVFRIDKSFGHQWPDPFDSNVVVAFQRAVEEYCIRRPLRSLPTQLSYETQHLCTDCNKVVRAVIFGDLEFPTCYQVVQYPVLVLTDCARYAFLLNRSLEQILVDNICKLRERYPDGFTAERSINRSET